jgi:D-inositol-3-phosphate glycosyltransferase
MSGNSILTPTEKLAKDSPQSSGATKGVSVSVLTGGGDRPYVHGLTTALISKGVSLDIIGSNEVDFPDFHGKPGVRFLNLRGDQRTEAALASKATRVIRYYVKLIRYAATAKPRIFHILWNNKFEHFDRTLLIYYYKLLGKRIVLTVHNVNTRKRDNQDSSLNRFTLRIQYRLADHIFVHTEQMKLELQDEFGIEGSKVTVIPFGINNSVPNTELSRSEARRRLGLGENQKVILFFGNITPYKGLEYLVAAFQKIASGNDEFRLLIAGWPKNCAEYWAGLQQTIRETFPPGAVIVRDQFIPDEETEVYFKAADVFVLPYKHVYQSGAMFLAYNFGLPVVAADVGALKDDIVAGETGFVFRPEDPADLTAALARYFASELYAQLARRRSEIRAYVAHRHSWDNVGQTTVSIYARLLQTPHSEIVNQDSSRDSLDLKAPS